MYLPRQNNPLLAAVNATTTSLAVSDHANVAPKSAITVAIAVALLAIGFGISRLVNRCYKQATVTDSRSDLSDHTKQLLKLQKTARRRHVISESEMRQWQVTVLSMWRNRPSDEEDDGFLDEHGQMLKRLRDAWLGRRRCHHGTAPCAKHTGCFSSSSRWATPEEFADEVRRVAHAWLEFSRSAEASVKLRDRRRRLSHHVMMRRLSRAWRERGLALDRMRTIEEAADASCEDAVSFVSVGKAGHLAADPDAGRNQTYVNARDTDDGAQTSQLQMLAEPDGGSVMPASQGIGGYCHIL